MLKTMLNSKYAFDKPFTIIVTVILIHLLIYILTVNNNNVHKTLHCNFESY